MASISTGPIVSEIRGKIGDTIYSRNTGGAYSKAYVVPVQPNTAIQLTRRAQMAEAIANWQALSDDERMLWVRLSELTRSKGSLLKGRRAGYSLFVSRDLNRQIIGGSIPPTPNYSNFAPLGQVSWVSLTTEEMRYRLDTDTPNSRAASIEYISPPLSEGTMSVNSTRFTFISGQSPFDSFTTGNRLSAWEAIYGPIAGHVGKKIFVKMGCMIVYLPATAGPSLKPVYQSTYFETYASAIIQPAP